MCCSNGICGPSVDEKLIRIQELILDLQKNYADEVEVKRYMISAQPMEFMSNPVVAEILQNEGPDKLPVVTVDGELLTKQIYPTKEQIMDVLKK
ncbi:hypothetical protein BHF68_07325 [Desulfuribacillus alkaliarsenatis]|uniref:Uncharacterized protein n=2 Tax=Desulfuribacillus alkaliarsenatis TaxID=766136 RepID=A0A1E5G146_9FIRM|nr:hypothetical protein BHF68_07325 [Desulfuribacillus alkaliarsenatis]